MAVMTKNEELAALAKIEKILTSAGPDSYIGMAFAGCCEIARNNIENDFGDSFQESLEIAKRNAATEHDMRLSLEYEVDHLNREVARKSDELEELRKQLKAEQQKQLPAELYKRLRLAINDHIEIAESRIAGYVEILAAYADAPKDIAVADALKGLQQAHSRRIDFTSLLEDLGAYEQKEVDA